MDIDDAPIIIESLPSEEKPTDRRAFTIDDDTEFVENATLSGEKDGHKEMHKAQL